MPAFALHGHFYQPPRENPWTESVPRELSAAPFHDWNERITAECYRPNAFARIVDADRRVVAIVNNYGLMSFDLGPTLASWLAEHEPEVLDRIIAADRESHTAIAHPWHHAILPLALPRDARTEIRWGIAEFRHRFGRDPKGFWLPETALDDTTLSLLIDEGISFTIVAPSQIDQPPSGVPARWHHRDGRGIDLVVYDGELSHQLAFSMAEIAAEDLLATVGKKQAALVVGATDGETFGHHHHYTERAVAYALAVLAKRGEVVTGVNAAPLAQLIDSFGDRQRVAVHPSAWSCAHGLGRWQIDCGCNSGGHPGWNQAWRAPLRKALDLLRNKTHSVFEHRGSALFHHPWAARDAYVSVLLGATGSNEFGAEHVLPGADLSVALTLLEAERHALAMYTSCGWFFDDLAGLETVQVLRYAARCLDLLAELGEESVLEAFLDVLATGSSNDPVEGDGRRVWERRVMSARVDAERIVAHLALLELLRGGSSNHIGPFHVHIERHARTVGPNARLETGRVRLVHRRTHRTTQWSYAVAGDPHYEVLGVVAPADDPQARDAMAVELHRIAASNAPIGDLHDRMVARHGGRRFGLDVLVMDLAPRLSNDLAAPALLALVRRALATGATGHVRAARRFLRTLAIAGISVDLAPAQELYYRSNEEKPVPVGLHELGFDLGLAVTSLGLPH
ncbi:MAG: DUF3536 domain-containing protein [Acidimicrobiia bacterium]